MYRHVKQLSYQNQFGFHQDNFKSHPFYYLLFIIYTFDQRKVLNLCASIYITEMEQSRRED